MQSNLFENCLYPKESEHVNFLLFFIAEVDCGIPPTIQHAELLWNPRSSLGSVVHYSCQEGFDYVGGNNISVCTEEGVWVKSTLTCTGRV